MITMQECGLLAKLTRLRKEQGYVEANARDGRGFPVLGSTGKDGQKRIESEPEQYWRWRRRDLGNQIPSPTSDRPSAPILRHSGHLLVTEVQRLKSARLTAVAGDVAYVGNGWLPIPGADPIAAKALAVFLNATHGRLQIMRNAGQMLAWQRYSIAGYGSIRIPDPTDSRKMTILADCWEQTKDMLVPQFGEGECEVRQIWDNAVAEAMGWDADELTRLRLLLHKEPHVSGRRYGHYSG